MCNETSPPKSVHVLPSVSSNHTSHSIKQGHPQDTIKPHFCIYSHISHSSRGYVVYSKQYRILALNNAGIMNTIHNTHACARAATHTQTHTHLRTGTHKQTRARARTHTHTHNDGRKRQIIAVTKRAERSTHWTFCHYYNLSFPSIVVCDKTFSEWTFRHVLSTRSDKTCSSDKTCRQCIKFDTFCHLSAITWATKRAVVTKHAGTGFST